ncbi:hypothetical protein BI335_03885 [Enemella evansiae]|nr:hypothetical protein BI335_03885 [Enemella evansiae]
MVDVGGVLRRVRRALDLNQREFAERLGVSASHLARWETGQRSPRVPELVAALELAGFTLHVLDADGNAVRPMGEADTVRDRQGRFLPAHLDVELIDPYFSGLVPCAPRRARREQSRARRGEVPVDHPTAQDVIAAEHARRERRRAKWEQERALGLLPVPAPTPFVCTCPSDCDVLGPCVPSCPCRCGTDLEPWAEGPELPPAADSGPPTTEPALQVDLGGQPMGKGGDGLGAEQRPAGAALAGQGTGPGEPDAGGEQDAGGVGTAGQPGE